MTMGEDNDSDDTLGSDKSNDGEHLEAAGDEQIDSITFGQQLGSGSFFSGNEPNDSDDSDKETLLNGRISPAQRAQAEQAVTRVLAVMIVLAVVGVVFVVLAPPQPGTPFTEFYLLGPNGTASGYPTTLATEETGTVIVGISNHERKSVEYRLRVTWNRTETIDRTISIPDGETSELPVSLRAPSEPGLYRVRFLLYNETGSDPYMHTRLWVQVRNGSGFTTNKSGDSTATGSVRLTGSGPTAKITLIPSDQQPS